MVMDVHTAIFQQQVKKIIINILKEKGVPFYYNYFINKIDKEEVKQYRVDFYFPKLNLIIEYNGSQHYNATTCFGSATKETADQRLLEQKARDECVNIFCKKHNINIIWIDGRKYYTHKLKKYFLTDILPLLTSIGRESKDIVREKF